MRIDILTIFPGMVAGPLDESIIKRARERGIARIAVHDLREYTVDRHRMTDDTPFGGGPGMVMKPEPYFRAVDSLVRGASRPRVILMDPQGKVLDQQLAWELAEEDHLILLCGRYEGVDERVRSHLVTDEISIGDYVLSGGEPAALVLTDAVVRLLPGALGDEQSPLRESFADGLLEGPQYTRPRSYRGLDVPEILLSGDHGAIEKWRRRQSLLRTAQRRPDLLEKAELTAEEREFLRSERFDLRRGGFENLP